jgi:hypothetical protein
MEEDDKPLGKKAAIVRILVGVALVMVPLLAILVLRFFG